MNEPKDGIGFHIKFKIGKKEYEIKDEGKTELDETINWIELLIEQGKQKHLDKEIQMQVLKDSEKE